MKEKYVMLDSPLRESGRKDFHPKEAIEESIRGVEFDFYYTGKKMGSGKQIELHITSIVRDWEENVFIRKSWYNGNRGTWKSCIESHLRHHLTDLGTDKTLVTSLLRYFEIKEENFREWNNYNPVYYQSVFHQKKEKQG